MAEIEVSIDIAFSPQVVWDDVSKLETHVEWMADAESIEFVGESHSGEGTVMQVLGSVLVVALSGGYSREEANERLARQNGMVASFSRALSEGLSAQQSDEAFDAMLDESIASIFAASST